MQLRTSSSHHLEIPQNLHKKVPEKVNQVQFDIVAHLTVTVVELQMGLCEIENQNCQTLNCLESDIAISTFLQPARSAGKGLKAL